MGVPGSGLLSYVGWGVESTWGTAVARTKFDELSEAGESMKLDKPQVIMPAMRGLSPRRFVPGPQKAMGAINLLGKFEGQGQLWRHLFNTSAPTSGPTNVSVYTHTFTLAQTLLAGLSVEVERDIQAYLYEGCRVQGVTIECEAGGPLKLAFDLLAEDESTVSATPATYPPEKLIDYSLLVGKADDVAFDLRRFRVGVRNPFTEHRSKFGSALSLSFERTGAVEVDFEFVADFETTAQYQKFTGVTPEKLNFIATGAVIASSSPATNESWDLEIPRSLITGNTPNVGGPGVIEQTITGRGLYNLAGSAEQVKLTMKNSESAL